MNWDGRFVMFKCINLRCHFIVSNGPWFIIIVMIYGPPVKFSTTYLSVAYISCWYECQIQFGKTWKTIFHKYKYSTVTDVWWCTARADAVFLNRLVYMSYNLPQNNRCIIPKIYDMYKCLIVRSHFHKNHRCRFRRNFSTSMILCDIGSRCTSVTYNNWTGILYKQGWETYNRLKQCLTEVKGWNFVRECFQFP